MEHLSWEDLTFAKKIIHTDLGVKAMGKIMEVNSRMTSRERQGRDQRSFRKVVFKGRRVLLVGLMVGLLLAQGGVLSLSQGGETFTSSDRLVATYHFYWYDIHSGLHIIDPDGSDALTHHPPDEFLSDFSYKEVSWHRRELLDMMEAGIDVVLPVYWGSDAEKFWSIEGLRKLVEAEQQLIAEGKRLPKIGMFFDTTALYQQNYNRPLDLTLTRGKAIFYRMVKDFYSIVPRELWAQIDEQPIIWLYTAAPWISAYDQGIFDFLKEHFQADFGKIPYVVREASWSRVVTENKYRWGAALLGPSMASGVASIGPGYDESECYGRVPPKIQDRRGGQFYRESWEMAIHSGRNITVIETWNELHEGTEIAHTKEFGRHYIQLTAEYVPEFKSTPPMDFSSANKVSVDLGASPRSMEIEVSVNWPDGAWKPAQVRGVQAVHTDNSTNPPSYYIYFDVYDDFLYAQADGVWVQVAG